MIGRAMLKEVASRAAARVIIQMLMKAKRNPLLGLKAGWKFSRGAMDGWSVDSGCGGISGEVFSSREESVRLEGDDIVVDRKDAGEMLGADSTTCSK
jgi:hypothetical protein